MSEKGKFEMPIPNDGERLTVFDSLDLPLRQAIEQRDAETAIDLIDMRETDSTLEVISSRLEIRELWMQRKVELAGIAEETRDRAIEPAVVGFIQSMDADLDRVVDNIGTDEEKGSLDALKDHLHSLEPKVALGFLQRVSQVDRTRLSTNTDLIPWVAGFRDQIVEKLWPIVLAEREEMDKTSLATAADTTYEQINDMLDRLIRGAVES